MYIVKDMDELIPLEVFKLEKRHLKVSKPIDDMPTGISCPLCWSELHVNMTSGGDKRHPTWCSNDDCLWRGWL